MAAILKFFKRHLLPDHKSDWTKTWWEASEWHRDSKLLKSFHSDIQDGSHGHHLEILSNDISSQIISQIEQKLDGRYHSDTEIQNCYNRSVPISKTTTTTAIFKFFKQHLLPNHKSDWAKTWWEASQSDIEIQNCWNLSDIQDGSHLEILQITSPPKL